MEEPPEFWIKASEKEKAQEESSNKGRRVKTALRFFCKRTEIVDLCEYDGAQKI